MNWKSTASGVEEDGDEHEAGGVEEEPDHEQPDPDARREGDGREEGGAEAEEGVGLLVLDRVPDLVRRDCGSADRDLVVDGVREVHRALAGVVVIRERPAGRDVHRNLVQAVGVENRPGDLRAGHAARDGDPRLLGERLLQPPLHTEADEQGRNEEGEVETPAAHLTGS